MLMWPQTPVSPLPFGRVCLSARANRGLALPNGRNMSDDDLPPWLSIKRTAGHIDASERHVRRLIASGDLEARRVGKRLIRVSRESVLKFGEPVGPR